MIGLESESVLWLSLVCLALTTFSAVVPWVNAELVVLSLPLVAHSRAELAALVLVAAAGQMAGKCLVYWAGRKGAERQSPRMARGVDRWRERFAARPWAPLGFVLLSSAIGVPPFYVISLLAGAMRVDFARYVVVGTAGRLIRFGAIAFLPQTVVQLAR